MLADIYRTRRANTFILVPYGSALTSVPGKLISDLGDPIFLNTRDLKDKSLGVDGQEIISELMDRGFSVCERNQQAELPSVRDFEKPSAEACESLEQLSNS